MPLNWSVIDVKDWKKKQRKLRNRLVLKALIFSTLEIGIREITEKNYLQFFARLTAYEHVNEPYCFRLTPKKPIRAYITLEEVKMWIGLKTNASKFSAAKFEEKLVN